MENELLPGEFSQGEFEVRPAVVVGPDIAPVDIDDPLDDGQPYARTAPIAPIEGLEKTA